MSNWKSFKKWICDTISFRFIKNLILDKDNSNLKETIGWFLGLTFMVGSLYSLWAAKTGDEREKVLWIDAFVMLLLFGIDITSKGWKKFSDNKTKREMNKPMPDDKHS